MLHAAAGVASADDVQVCCTISSVSVAVPDRYLLQLSLPFCIKDEAESVKFSSRKQPPTLNITLVVEGSILQQPASQVPPAAAPSQGSHSTRRRRRQQQQQQQQPASNPVTNSSISSSSRPGPCGGRDIVEDLQARGPMDGEKSEWLLPLAIAAEWIERRGGEAALDSLLWTLSPYPKPRQGKPRDLVRLTPHNIVLAVLTALLFCIMFGSAGAYMMVRGVRCCAAVIAVHEDKDSKHVDRQSL
jgi:hypothetical protein